MASFSLQMLKVGSRVRNDSDGLQSLAVLQPNQRSRNNARNPVSLRLFWNHFPLELEENPGHLPHPESLRNWES